MDHRPPGRMMELPISLEVWQQLLGAALTTGYKKEHWEIAEEAIGEWIRRHDPDAISMPLVHGYQWKSVFLPDGTLLRTVFGGKNHHCLVENDGILYNGQAVSPSSFVNAVGGIRRNAWRSLWILFPGSNEWKLADTLRARTRPRQVRKPARDFRQTSAPQPAAGRVPDDVTPLAPPLPAQGEYNAAREFEGPQVQSARDDRFPSINPNADQDHRRRGPGMTLAPAGVMYGTDRRVNADDRMVALLRHELLPMLRRMSAFEGIGMAHEPRAPAR